MKTWVWVVLAAVLAGLAGEQVGEWRATAEHAEATQARAKEAQEDAAKILALSGSNAQLLLSIAAQNQAVAVAEAQSAAAQETARRAQEHAKDMAQLSESRMVKIEKALKEAKTVGEVLSRYWELRQ